MWFKSIRDAKLRLFTSSPNPWWPQRTKTISADKQAQNWTAGLVLREVSYCYLCEHEDLLQTGPGLTRWVMDNTIFQRRLFCPNLTEFLPSMQHVNYIATSPQYYVCDGVRWQSGKFRVRFFLLRSLQQLPAFSRCPPCSIRSSSSSVGIGSNTFLWRSESRPYSNHTLAPNKLQNQRSRQIPDHDIE